MRCGKYTLDLKSEVHVMGILNVTPDSFSDGGRYFGDPQRALDHALGMEEEGASLIDIGGESTRPGSRPIDDEEEWERIEPVLRSLGGRLKLPISIDTMKASVARKAIGLGASIINDVSAGRTDPEILEVVASSDVGFILMHMQGTPETMQQVPKYQDVIGEIRTFFKERLGFFRSQGIDPERVILDPGLGFGKEIHHNLMILKRLEELRESNRPLLIGASRKSFIGSQLDLNIHERLEGSLACAVLAVWNGAKVIRAHDVRPTARAIKMARAIRLANASSFD